MDKESQTCKVCIETPWDATSLSQLYSRLDEVLPDDLAGTAGINFATPIHYNPEEQTFVVELVIDLQDLDLHEDSESED